MVKLLRSCMGQGQGHIKVRYLRVIAETSKYYLGPVLFSSTACTSSMTEASMPPKRKFPQFVSPYPFRLPFLSFQNVAAEERKNSF